MCLAALLDAGANPNALDANLKSPIYYGEFIRLIGPHRRNTSTLYFTKSSDSYLASSAFINFAFFSKAAERKNIRALEMLEANGGLLDQKEKELTLSHHCKTPTSSTNATSTVTATLNQFNERGERLNEMKHKTANLESVAIEYKNMAQQMKKNAKSEKIFGIF